MEKDPQPHNQTFKIHYQQCKIHAEKLNYICLDTQCFEMSLICSICKDLKHSRHSTRPLKFYLNELKEKYKDAQGKSNLNELLEDLQISQYTFCQKLKKTVQQVALQFQKLEQQMIQEINSIRNQIFEEIAKRSRFNEFYANLRIGKINESNFIIQNYLPQANIGNISKFEVIQKLSVKICNDISILKKDLISRQSITQISKHPRMQFDKYQNQSLENCQVFDLNKVIKVPSKITYTDSVLVQSNSVLVQSNSIFDANSLSLIDYPVTEISGKLSFKVLQLNKNAVVIIGVMTKEVYESMKECWTEFKLKDKASFALGSNGFAFGWKKRLITQFGQGSTLSLCCQSNELKIQQKSKYCSSQIPTGTQLFVVIALMGHCQVKITHKK